MPLTENEKFQIQAALESDALGRPLGAKLQHALEVDAFARGVLSRRVAPPRPPVAPDFPVPSPSPAPVVPTVPSPSLAPPVPVRP